MADAKLICPKRIDGMLGHEKRSDQQLQVWTDGLGLRCPGCGHRGRVAEFYFKSVSIAVPPASAVGGGGIPGAPG